jgi:hypothetical protein
MNDAQLQGRHEPPPNAARALAQTPETSGFFERAA